MRSLSVEFRDRNDHFSSGFVHLDTKNVPYRPRVRRCADSDNLLFGVGVERREAFSSLNGGIARGFAFVANRN